MSRKSDVLSYEATIRIIRNMCNSVGKSSNVMDDVQSDIIFQLWSNGGFEWDGHQVRRYVGGAIRNALRKAGAAKAVLESQIGDDDSNALSRLVKVRPHQHTHLLAKEALAILKTIEPDQAKALLILGDGGTPLEVAEEMQLDPWAAVRKIREARAAVRNEYERRGGHA